MATAQRLSAPTTSPELVRDRSVDLARGLALLSMFVAHTAPTGGPGGLFNLSEWLTAALFATLVGIGAAHSRVRAKAVTRFFAVALIRGAVLIVLGLALLPLEQPAVIILVHLGVLLWLAALAALLPRFLVVVLGALLAVAGASLKLTLLDDWWNASVSGRPVLAHLLELGFTGQAYRVSHLLAWACLGIVLASRRRDNRFDAALGVGSLVIAGGLMAAYRTGQIEMTAYSGTLAEVAFNALLCTAVVAMSSLVIHVLPLRASNAFIATGSMTLSLYVLHILVLAAYVALASLHAPFASWSMLLGLTGMSIALAALWPRFIRRQPWNRGPLEGPVDWVIGRVRSL